jgi:hypothetical protein
MSPGRSVSRGLFILYTRVSPKKGDGKIVPEDVGESEIITPHVRCKR